MSQIYKNNSGGGGGGVISVTGINNLIVSPNTGNVVADGVNFLFHTPFVNNINFKVNAKTPLYTVPAGKSFIFTGAVIVVATVTGFTSDMAYSIGVTSPFFDDYVLNGSTGFVSGVNSYVNSAIRDGNSGSVNVVATAGQVIYLNLTNPVGATTATANVCIYGFIF